MTLLYLLYFKAIQYNHSLYILFHAKKSPEPPQKPNVKLKEEKISQSPKQLSQQNKAERQSGQRKRYVIGTLCLHYKSIVVHVISDCVIHVEFFKPDRCSCYIGRVIEFFKPGCCSCYVGQCYTCRVL